MRGCEYISDLILKRRVSAVSKDGREFMRWVVLRDACGVYHRAARSLSSGAHSRDPLARTRWQAPQDEASFLHRLESGDPYAVSLVLRDGGRRLSRNGQRLWLWVPAFAGTTHRAAYQYLLLLKFRDRLDPTRFGRGKGDLIAGMHRIQRQAILCLEIFGGAAGIRSNG